MQTACPMATPAAQEQLKTLILQAIQGDAPALSRVEACAADPTAAAAALCLIEAEGSGHAVRHMAGALLERFALHVTDALLPSFFQRCLSLALSPSPAATPEPRYCGQGQPALLSAVSVSAARSPECCAVATAAALQRAREAPGGDTAAGVVAAQLLTALAGAAAGARAHRSCAAPLEQRVPQVVEFLGWLMAAHIGAAPVVCAALACFNSWAELLQLGLRHVHDKPVLAALHAVLSGTPDAAAAALAADAFDALLQHTRPDDVPPAALRAFVEGTTPRPAAVPPARIVAVCRVVAGLAQCSAVCEADGLAPHLLRWLLEGLDAMRHCPAAVAYLLEGLGAPGLRAARRQPDLQALQRARLLPALLQLSVNPGPSTDSDAELEWTRVRATSVAGAWAATYTDALGPAIVEEVCGAVLRDGAVDLHSAQAALFAVAAMAAPLELDLRQAPAGPGGAVAVEGLLQRCAPLVKDCAVARPQGPVLPFCTALADLIRSAPQAIAGTAALGTAFRTAVGLVRYAAALHDRDLPGPGPRALALAATHALHRLTVFGRDRVVAAVREPAFWPDSAVPLCLSLPMDNRFAVTEDAPDAPDGGAAVVFAVSSLLAATLAAPDPVPVACARPRDAAVARLSEGLVRRLSQALVGPAPGPEAVATLGHVSAAVQGLSMRDAALPAARALLLALAQGPLRRLSDVPPRVARPLAALLHSAVGAATGEDDAELLTWVAGACPAVFRADPVGALGVCGVVARTWGGGGATAADHLLVGLAPVLSWSCAECASPARAGPRSAEADPDVVAAALAAAVEFLQRCPVLLLTPTAPGSRSVFSAVLEVCGRCLMRPEAEPAEVALELLDTVRRLRFLPGPCLGAFAEHRPALACALATSLCGMCPPDLVDTELGLLRWLLGADTACRGAVGRVFLQMAPQHVTEGKVDDALALPEAAFRTWCKGVWDAVQGSAG